MALKQADQIRFDALATLIQTVKNLGHDYNTVLNAASQQIAEFQEATGQAVRVKSNFEIELIDRRKDFLRIRSPNAESKVLRTKVDGVAIDVKIFKEGDYDFDNETIASSLRRLADEVAGIPKPLVEFPDCEVKEHLEEISGATPDEEELEESEGELQEENEDLGLDSVGNEASSHPNQYVSDPETSETAQMEDDEEEGAPSSEPGSFKFEDSFSSNLDDDSETESDRLFD